MITSRRGILGGMLALVAAPAIVKVSSLMPVRGVPLYSSNLLTVDMITREAVKMFVDSDAFLQSLEKGIAEDIFTRNDGSLLVGSVLRIKLPNDYQVVK